MSITFSGLATGLDTDNIVKELMTIERAPIDRIEARKTSETQKLKAYEQFNDKLKELRSIAGSMYLTSQVRSTSISLAQNAPFTAESESGAIGSYNVSVAQLSQVQKTVSSGFTSKTASVLGTGTMTVNGTTINVTAENNSLVGIVEEINKQSDTTGVTATIINDGSASSPYHLVFTGEDSATTFTIESSLTDPESVPTFTNSQEAQQAVAYIDGIKIVSDTNTISEAISGVTITLNSVSEQTYAGNPTPEEIAGNVDPLDWADPPQFASTTLTVEADKDSLKEKLTDFVTAYNGIIDWINSGYEEFGGSSKVIEPENEDEEAVLGALLRGDASVNGIKRQLQSVLTDVIKNDGEFQILSEIGITTDHSTGKLQQNNSKLNNALDNNFDDMVSLLAGQGETEGVMKKFNSLLLNLTSGADGFYATQKNSYDSKMRSYDSKLDLMEVRMTKREASLRAQFAAMETLVSNLNAQGDFLTQQMNALNRKK